MQRKAKVLSMVTIIVLLVCFSLIAAGWAQVGNRDKSGNKKVSPTVTNHTIYLGYHHFQSGGYGGPPASPYLTNTGSSDKVFATGINIPANATITEFTFHAKMTYNWSTTDERLVMRLKYTGNNGSVGTETDATVWGNYVAGRTWFATKGKTVSIPVNNRPMYIWLTLPGTPDANDYEVAWIRVKYTTP